MHVFMYFLHLVPTYFLHDIVVENGLLIDRNPGLEAKKTKKKTLELRTLPHNLW